MTKSVLILNLDTFAAKNVSQIRLMEAEGYDFTVATGDSRGTSRKVFEAAGFARSRLVTLAGLRDKLATVFRLLRTTRFHHVELYPAGRAALVYLPLIKLFRQRLVVVERGDIASLHLYDAATRLAVKLAYRLADCVVYKETYMAPLLEALSRAPLAFVPNSVEPRPVERAEPRQIDFLWANRIVPQRRPEWVADAMAAPGLTGCSLVMLGVEPETTLDHHLPDRQRNLRAIAAPNIEIEAFVDPEPRYRQARFFCLPSEIVFGNNALLEAMASGVVPIVTEAPGVELIVEDGVNGIVVPLEEDAYREAMIRAAAMDEAEWLEMSRKAIEAVTNRYSPVEWTRRMREVYVRLGAG